jgi:hypothetical protein
MDKVTVEERLNDIISEKENEIDELNDKVSNLESLLDYHKWSWCRHTTLDKSIDLYKNIPFPRLEMKLSRVSENNWYEIEWIYGLVYGHFSDVAYNNNLLFIPFSQTTSRGGAGTFESHFIDSKLDLPFRDGVHIKVDALTLNLPAYISCAEKGIIQKIEITEENKINWKDILNKMKQ